MRKLIKKHENHIRILTYSSKNSINKSIDIIKVFTLTISMLGIITYLSGRSFLTGYWEASGLSILYFQFGIQDIMFYGFLPGVNNWLNLAFIILVFSVYLILISIRVNGIFSFNFFEKFVSQNSKLKRLFYFDEKFAALIIYSLVLAFFLFVVVMLTIFWISINWKNGEKAFNRQKELAITGKSKNQIPVVLKIDDGKESKFIEGYILQGAEKYSVIMDYSGDVHLISMNDKVSIKSIVRSK